MSTTGANSLALFDEILSTVEPRGCIVPILGLFIRLCNLFGTGVSDDILEEPGYAERRDAALNIASRWLTLRRNPAQVNAILTRNCVCSEEEEVSELHVLGAGWNRDPLEATAGQLLVQWSTFEIRRLLYKMKNVKQYKYYRLAESRSIWPYGTAHLLPHGPEETIRGYFDWLAAENAMMMTATVMEAFSTIVEYAWPIMVPTIIKKHLLLEEFIQITSRWSTYMIALEEGDDRALYGPTGLHVLNIFLQVSVAMRTICVSCSTPVASAYFLRPRHAEIIVSCDLMLFTATTIVERGDVPEARRYREQLLPYVKAVAVTVYRHFPQHRTRLRHLAKFDITPERARREEITTNMAWTVLLEMLQYQHIRQQCSAPDCDRTVEQNGRRFQYCAGCCHVPYCSRRCQRKAWKRDDGLQHRDVCALIWSLSTQHDLLEITKYMKNVSTARTANLSQEEERVVEMINKHFSALTIHELEG